MKRTWAVVAVLLVFAMVTAAACSTGTLDSTRTRTQKVQRLNVDAHNTAAAVEVNQSSTGPILQLKDASTEVARVADGGDFEIGQELRVGAGTPDATQAANSVYVKGGLEVDGAIRADGGISGSISNDLDGGTLTIGGDAGVTLNETTDDLIEFTFGAGAGYLNLLVGNLKVGNGANGTALNGEDAYIEGTLEVDGAAKFDGGVTTTTITGANAETIDNTTNGYWEIGAAGLTQTADTQNGIGFTSWDEAAVITTTNGTLWTVPASQTWAIEAVFCKVTTNFDCVGNDCTLTIGNTEDADGFLTLADAELQAADTEGTGFDAGWQGLVAATIGAYLDPGGMYPIDQTDTIDIKIEDTSDTSNPTAGAAACYLKYTRIK